VLLTAAVCAHNEGRFLAGCLRSLAAQDAADFEILVVDNASTDETAELARQFAGREPRARVVREEVLGLSAARNRALAEARGQVVAFIDADAVADPAWLSALGRAFREEPAAAVVGGRVLVRWGSPPPRWWAPALDEVFNRFDYPEPRKEMRYPRYPYGTNLAVHVEIGRRLGGFHTRLGRHGQALLAAEEVALCWRAECAGHKVVYTRDALVHHLGRNELATRSYILRRALAHGSSQRLAEKLADIPPGSFPGPLRFAVTLLADAARLRLSLARLKYHAFRLGYIAGPLIGTK
jgi:glycosyltransferase involved in cell wall biosynthesis